MICFRHGREGAELLLEYCAQTLDSARAREVERHLQDCTECRRAAEQQMDVWATLGRWTPPPVSANFDTRLYARIAQEEAEPEWKKWTRRVLQPAAPVAFWKPAVSLGAACAVLAVALAVHAPQGPETGPQVHADSVDIEQVAKTLDDLDFLAPSSAM